ncbi:response regulator [Fuchsiella alkaliacetigena]|uniref:response regulator n=1 Tax=Fuchsiella alkaliacetigena TaxID=957042 RepID=UPI00200A5EF5|nr:response regulator [Fuchsiella alkaliacetigena]MCK8823539.1 response regulator [Fuchsiella alkaliacetigena]
MGKKILIVDDGAFMRMMIKDILIENKFRVVGEAADGEEAVLLYKKLNPDLVTMDITMPKKDGITATKEIIAEDPQANILICSAMGEDSMVVQAIRAGAKGFIVKPFQKERVIQAIDKVLSK